MQHSRNPYRSRSRRRTALVALALVPLSLALVACGDDSDDGVKAQGPDSTVATTVGGTDAPTTDAPTTEAPADEATVIDVTARDYMYDMPDMGPFRPGLVTIRLTNAGKEAHHAHLARLKDGVTMQQITAADEETFFSLVDFMGGSNTVEPGATQETSSFLTEGNYVMICFMTTADGTPHVAKGMVMPFEVKGEATSTPAPEVDGTVVADDYSLTLPEGFGSGEWELVNHGKEPHELTIIKMNDGLTADDAMQWMMDGGTAPMPFTFAGGLGVIHPGGSVYGSLDLGPGNYIALCFVPGPGGAPHVAMGMMTPFTIG